MSNKSKLKKLPFSTFVSSSLQPFDLIHVDIWGPTELSFCDFKYFLTIVDDCTRFTWSIMMKQKGEASQLLKQFYEMVKTQFNKKIKIIRSDNGPEFKLSTFYANKGILHQTSCVETPQQNGIIERKHQHILNVARCFKNQSNLPKSIWKYFISHVFHVINRVPTPFLNNVNPYEKLYGKIADYDDLKTFGCLCFASTLSRDRTKFDNRGEKYVFLGYIYGIKEYRLYSMETNKFTTSRNFKFYETFFPYNRLDTKMSNDEERNNARYDEDEKGSPESKEDSRKAKQPSYLGDYYCYLAEGKNITELENGKLYPLTTMVNYSNISSPQKAFSVAISLEQEPKTYKAAAEKRE